MKVENGVAIVGRFFVGIGRATRVSKQITLSQTRTGAVVVIVETGRLPVDTLLAGSRVGIRDNSEDQSSSHSTSTTTYDCREPSAQPSTSVRPS